MPSQYFARSLFFSFSMVREKHSRSTNRALFTQDLQLNLLEILLLLSYLLDSHLFFQMLLIVGYLRLVLAVHFFVLIVL